ncbi:hypothetical protein R7035_26035, partial [Vibrio sp. 1731]|uniref:hypothetical protein n=1 Tax=Vibrio sp. 1731 TaxID=3074573 RepID=UPI0029644A95
ALTSFFELVPFIPTEPRIFNPILVTFITNHIIKKVRFSVTTIKIKCCFIRLAIRGKLGVENIDYK